MATDITKLKRAEEELTRLNRTLQTLYQCNQALVRATEEYELLRSVCRILVEVGDLRMAWVGYRELDEEKTVRPVAWAGYEEGYLERIDITWADKERGRGPTGTAIRTGAPCWNNDFLTDPKMAPWGAEALRRGYASNLSLPLMSHGEAFGALALYAGDPAAFNENTFEQYADLANNLAFGVTALRTREERKRAEKALRESEARFRSLFERSADSMTLFDPEIGRFIDANDAAARQIGAPSREALCDVSPVDISPERQFDGQLSSEKSAKIIQLASAQGSLRFEWLSRRYDGSESARDIVLTAIPFGERTLLFAVARDISEHKRAESEIRQLNASLEKRVAERTIELVRSNEQLKRAEERLLRALAKEKELGQLRSNFVSMVSHEFRTPLGIIQSSAEILDDYLDRLEPAERRDHLQSIRKNTRRMAGLMEEVLLLGTLDAGKMEFKPALLEIRTFLRRLVDEVLSATNRRCPIELLVDETPVEIQADERLLRHIFTNLLTNAIKYSDAGRVVRFEIECVGAELVCVIRDQGIGIPEADREWLFNPFHRGQNVGDRPGTGLGLVIVKRCVDLHGAKIKVESKFGEGTAVTVGLPILNRVSLL
jgi:PAS domain S-box-containing protein